MIIDLTLTASIGVRNLEFLDSLPRAYLVYMHGGVLHDQDNAEPTTSEAWLFLIPLDGHVKGISALFQDTYKSYIWSRCGHRRDQRCGKLLNASFAHVCAEPQRSAARHIRQTTAPHISQITESMDRFVRLAERTRFYNTSCIWGSRFTIILLHPPEGVWLLTEGNDEVDIVHLAYRRFKDVQ